MCDMREVYYSTFAITIAYSPKILPLVLGHSNIAYIVMIKAIKCSRELVICAYRIEYFMPG